MKVLNWVSHILWAMLACAPLTFEARATASFEDGRSAHTRAGSNVGPKRRDAAAAPSPHRAAMGPPRGRLARSAGAAAGSPRFTGSRGARPGPAGPPKLT